MSAPYPEEFRRHAVELARVRTKPVAELAKELRISESCLRNWMAQGDIDASDSDAQLTGKEKKELAELRRDKRRLEMEVEILKRAAAYPGDVAELLLMRAWAEYAGGRHDPRSLIRLVLNGVAHALLPQTVVDSWLLETSLALARASGPRPPALQTALAIAEPIDALRPFADAGRP